MQPFFSEKEALTEENELDGDIRRRAQEFLSGAFLFGKRKVLKVPAGPWHPFLKRKRARKEFRRRWLHFFWCSFSLQRKDTWNL
jgi:hypothetical protein